MRPPGVARTYAFNMATPREWLEGHLAPFLLRVLGARGLARLIADLGRVDFLDSTGLGALVGGVKRLREAGGSLCLVIRTPRILRIFQITGLTKALAIHSSVADAITADPHWQQTAESEAGSVHNWCEQHGLT